MFCQFTQFKVCGIWEEILDSLVVIKRKKRAGEPVLNRLATDSQSVKKMQFISQGTGIDGGKEGNGRKRTSLVDSPRLSQAIKVTGADTSDNHGGILALGG